MVKMTDFELLAIILLVIEIMEVIRSQDNHRRK